MGSELHRGLVRIISNYARLFISVCLGLVTVRLLLTAAGNSGWGLVLLLGSSIGIGEMFIEITRRSMVRELGAAYHSGDDDTFRTAYNSSLPIAAGASLIGALVFVLLWVLVPKLDVAPLDDTARGFIVAIGLAASLRILLIPCINMLLISERMVLFNLWFLIVQRGCQYIAALVVVVMLGVKNDPERAIVTYGWIAASISTVTSVMVVVGSMIADRRLVPSIRFISRNVIKSLLKSSGWNSAAVASVSLHLRVDQIIMNVVFGLSGNVVFGIGVLLSGYARRLTQGLTDGLDAVSARFEAERGIEGARTLIRQSTRLHGMIAFPAGLLVVALVEPLILFWLGNRLDNPGESIPRAVFIVRILMLGVMVRAISDSWVRILYGAGHVHRYAWVILIGGLLNPGLALLLIWVLPVGNWELAGPAISHTLILVVFHGIVLAIVTARITNQSVSSIFAPLLRPFIAALVPLPVLVAGVWFTQTWTIVWVVGLAAAYGGLYVLVTVVFTMDQEDRRIMKRLLNRIQRKKVESQT